RRPAGAYKRPATSRGFRPRPGSCPISTANTNRNRHVPDLLVRLYDLPAFPAEARVAQAGIVVRRALAPERYVVLAWIRAEFSPGWAGEAALALSQLPATLWLAE